MDYISMIHISVFFVKFKYPFLNSVDSDHNAFDCTWYKIISSSNYQTGPIHSISSTSMSLCSKTYAYNVHSRYNWHCHNNLYETKLHPLLTPFRLLQTSSYVKWNAFFLSSVIPQQLELVTAMLISTPRKFSSVSASHYGTGSY